MTNIEFPPLIEEWSFYVFLNDVGSFLFVVFLFAIDDPTNLVQLIDNFDAFPPVGVLARFDDPHILDGFGFSELFVVFEELLEGFTFGSIFTDVEC